MTHRCRHSLVVTALLITAATVVGSPGTATSDPRALASVNLLANGSAERPIREGDTSPAAWTPTTSNPLTSFDWVSRNAHGGRRSLKVISTTPSIDAWTQTVALDPAGLYRLSGWIKTVDVGLPGTVDDAGANLRVGRGLSGTPGVLGTRDWTFVSTLFRPGARRPRDRVCGPLGRGCQCGDRVVRRHPGLSRPGHADRAPAMAAARERLRPDRGGPVGRRRARAPRGRDPHGRGQGGDRRGRAQIREGRHPGADERTHDPARHCPAPPRGAARRRRRQQVLAQPGPHLRGSRPGLRCGHHGMEVGRHRHHHRQRALDRNSRPGSQ